MDTFNEIFYMIKRLIKRILRSKRKKVYKRFIGKEAEANVKAIMTLVKNGSR